MSVLYLIATPIGNLEDLSPRAQRLLGECDLILAEDTRVTRKLLSAFGINTPLESCHQHNEAGKAQQIIVRMREHTLRIALVTDAGTPAVSDPGALLVAAAHQAGIRVIAVPGPSAFAAALSAAGFEHTAFTFYGFLPRKQKELKEALESMRGGAPLAVMYESPHRVLPLLKAIQTVYPGCMLSVSRELSKLHEQTIRGRVEDVLARFAADGGLLRGEFVLVMEVPAAEGVSSFLQEALSLEGQLADALAGGSSLREAMAKLQRDGHRKNAVYAASLKLKTIAKSLLNAALDEGELTD